MRNTLIIFAALTLALAAANADEVTLSEWMSDYTDLHSDAVGLYITTAADGSGHIVAASVDSASNVGYAPTFDHDGNWTGALSVVDNNEPLGDWIAGHQLSAGGSTCTFFMVCRSVVQDEFGIILEASGSL